MAYFFYSRIYQPNVVMEYEKEVFVYIPTDATFEDVQQILIARGEQLKINQDDLEIQGHAIELRVYAEDPNNNFLPSIGTLINYQTPKGNGVRVDDGFEEGMDIPIYYDPMISKLISYGSDRNEAINRMIRAITEYKIDGCETTLPFGTFVMEHDAFISGDFDTNFVKTHFKNKNLNQENKTEAEIASKIAVYLMQNKSKAELNTSSIPSENNSKWKSRQWS